MLLIVDDNKWSSPVGDSLKEVFRREVYGLPQPEPMFDIIQIPNKAFSKLFETHRNIVRVRISPQNEENYVKVKRNVWSRPQVFFEIKAKNDSAFHSMFSKYKESILDSLVLSDRANYVDGFKKFHADETRRLLRGKGIDLMIPKGFIQKSKRTISFGFLMKLLFLTRGCWYFLLIIRIRLNFKKTFLYSKLILC
jgi:hypothetical protein